MYKLISFIGALLLIIFFSACVSQSHTSSAQTSTTAIAETLITKSPMEILENSGYAPTNITNGPEGTIGAAGLELSKLHDNTGVHGSLTLYEFDSLDGAKNYYNEIVKGGPLPRYKEASISGIKASCYGYNRDATVLYYLTLYCVKDNLVLYMALTGESGNYVNQDAPEFMNAIIKSFA